VYGVISELQQRTAGSVGSDETHMLREEVKDCNIASIVSHWAGISIEKMLEGEREKLLKMEEVWETRVVGQEEATPAISNATRRALDHRIPIDRLARSCSWGRQVSGKPSERKR